MSDDASSRTLPPSPKRLADARKRGDIALSRDLTAAATMTGGALGTLLCAGASSHALSNLMRAAMAGSDGDGVALCSLGVSAFATAAVPTAVGALLGWMVAAAAQLGWPPAFHAPGFDLSKAFGFKGVGQLLSPKAAAGRTLKALAKVLLVGLAGALAAARELRLWEHDPPLDPARIGERMMAASTRLFLYGGGGLVALAIFDYLITRRSWLSRLRMTPEEFRREHREQEGDPHVKRRRRIRMRELARRRLATAVKRADVVLVNPTEYAVALAYRSGEMRAPKVLAKGRGEAAERIRDLARKAGIPIVPEPPLTRAIWKLVPEDREIPPALYQAVATVLAHVYRLRRRRA